MPGAARALRALLLLEAVTAAVGPRASAAPKGPPPSTTPGEPSAAERRAVRGRALEEGSESPELREVLRFEQAAFPRAGEPPPPAPVPGDDQALPSGLNGRWGGTGDVPSELRSPEAARLGGRVAPMPDSAWLRSLAMPDLPMRWEPPVLRFLEYFKSDPRGRSTMTNFLRRMGRFEALIGRALEAEGVPRDLIYLAMIESGFEPRAMSNKSAGGVWQFMPDVARAYGLEVSYWVDARRDPEQAARAAARNLKDLYVRFGSWHLVFAAYHAGYGAILSSIARYNTNDYWELCKHEAGLPWETTLYVPKILAVALIGHNRAAFGFEEASDPPLAYDRVEARPGTTLAAVARAVGTPVEVIQSLNPELVRDRTPPDRGPVMVRVPPGSASLYAEGIEKARAAADRVQTYLLRFGESLDDVARAHGLTARELRRLNGLKDAAELRGGSTIVVPVGAAASGASAADGKPAAPAAGDDGDEALLVAVPERAFAYPDRERVFYRARDGDTLEEIASVFQVGADEIVEWNNVDPDARLHPRMVLQLYVRKGFDRAGVALLDADKLRVVTLGSEEFHALETARRGKTRLYYTAREGDTLGKIARRYGLAPADLARVNRLSYNSELSAGQRVVVYSPTPGLPREVTVGRSSPHKRPLGGPPLAKAGGGAPASRAVPAARPGTPAAAGKGAGAKAPPVAAKAGAPRPGPSAGKPGAGAPARPASAPAGKAASPKAKPAAPAPGTQGRASTAAKR
jgi:membrane-bound lytic murein transglycosylase D